VRELANSSRIEEFMRELGRAVQVEGRVYLTGGATAVLYGWRETTIDVDIKLIPDRDEILREIPRLKEKLSLNVELAAPSDFIPLPSGWEDRSPLIHREGSSPFIISTPLPKPFRRPSVDMIRTFATSKR
jgi:hypothetical protein